MGKEKVEQWTYLGRRLEGLKVYYAWLDPDGNEQHFNKLSALSPGRIYSVDVLRKKDGVSVCGKPSYHGEQSDLLNDLVIKACADDRAVAVALETRRAEKAESFVELEEHLDALRLCYNRQRGARRAAFLAHIIQRITRLSGMARS